MGLKCSGKTGVKAQLQQRFPQAFCRFDSLADARDASKAIRAQTMAVVDGNVLVMSVPQSCTTLDSYVAIVFSSLKQTVATAALTVVAFDDPAALTEAKRQEQQRRDAARGAAVPLCSPDMLVVPEGDDYDADDILRVPDVHALVHNRATRSRFLDEVCRIVLERLDQQLQRWAEAGFVGGAVIFDGVDLRGANRGKVEARAPAMVGSSEEAIALFRREQAIGEGDLKLCDLGHRAREQAGSGLLEQTTLNLCITIDTDSFAIELIAEAQRGSKPVSQLNTLLCMRERASKRDGDDEKKASFLACDIALLHALLQRNMWGASRQPSPSDQRAAMTLLAAGWGLAGCDFLEVKGMRSNLVFDAIGEVVRTRSASLQLMQHSWDGDRESLKNTLLPIKELLSVCASRLGDMPRVRKASVDAIRSAPESALLRACWLSSYWNLIEHGGDLSDFGFSPCFG